VCARARARACPCEERGAGVGPTPTPKPGAENRAGAARSQELVAALAAGCCWLLAVAGCKLQIASRSSQLVYTVPLTTHHIWWLPSQSQPLAHCSLLSPSAPPVISAAGVRRAACPVSPVLSAPVGQ
jgi:hypothetical protein